MAHASQIEYVVFFEKNTKEGEMFLFYVQWTGNEEELTKLANFINRGDYSDFDGDYSNVMIDTNVKFPESAVDLQLKLSDMNSFSRMFQKCTGIFKCPFSDKQLELEDGYEVAKLSDETFYTCRIRRMFK